MGAADLIPGISGGTVAFIMGFYDRLIESIKTFNASSLKLLFTCQWRSFFRATSWDFLLPLLIGILFSFVVLANLFQFVLNHEVYRLYFYSSFMGLIFASFLFCVRQVKEWSRLKFMALFLGCLAAYLLTGVEGGKMAGEYAIKISPPPSLTTAKIENYQPENELLTHLSAETLGIMLAKERIGSDTPVYTHQGILLGQVSDFIIPYRFFRLDPWLMACGAIAICALLLPGISGSYLLTLLGAYSIVIGALADLVMHAKQGKMDEESFFILLSLAIGIIGGLLLFARVISWLLAHYHDLTVALLSGFMIGAIGSIWPFWSYSYLLSPLKLEKGIQLVPVAPIGLTTIELPYLMYSLLFFILGFLLVLVLEYFSYVLSRKVRS